MTRLIVVIKYEESKPSCSQNNNKKSSNTVPKQALPADKGPASTAEHLFSQSSNHQLSNIQLLRRKEMSLKMDIDAVIKVILETSKVSSNNVVRMENWVQKLNGYIESCNEVRDVVIALISDDESAEEAQKWID